MKEKVETGDRGTCFFCEGTYATSRLGRHLKSCRARLKRVEALEEAARYPAYGVRATTRYSSPYSLYLEVWKQASLEQVDRLLRDVWLECCGHMSAFIIGGEIYSVRPTDHFGFGPRERSMNRRIGRVLGPGDTCTYEYDFGSTTELKLTVNEERIGAFPNNPVEVVARNLPPPTDCPECGKPATWICSQCLWEIDAAVVCDDCREKHVERDEEDYLLPLVNSPRAGVCGYSG
jgi:hypothetical protein